MECENTFEKKWSFPPYILRVTSIKKLFTVHLFEAKLIVSAVVILRRFVVSASNFWEFDITLSRWDSIYRYPPFTAHLHYEKSYLILLIWFTKILDHFPWYRSQSANLAVVTACTPLRKKSAYLATWKLKTLQIESDYEIVRQLHSLPF